MADFDAERIAALTELASAEAGLFAKLWDVFREWAGKLRRYVFGSAALAGPGLRMPDPFGVFRTGEWFVAELEPVLAEISEIWTDSAGFEADEILPDAQWGSREALRQARNRLAGVPDSVFASVRGATLKATTEGWSMEDLSSKIQDILGENDQASWRGRAMTIARTEALAAYNGGKFASFTKIASQTGEPWDKMWLATHDHRTRETHTKDGGGDRQRVPLMQPFRIGRSELMFPGDPTGQPEEIINCRCSLLLLEPGEHPDLSDQHYRSAR